MKCSGLDLTYLLTKEKENVQERILKFCATLQRKQIVTNKIEVDFGIACCELLTWGLA